MAERVPTESWTDTTVKGQASLRYIAPFVLFLAVLAIFGHVPIKPAWQGPLWFLIFVPICVLCWPREISVRPIYWMASVGIGTLAFLLWVAPDILIPGYRNSALFSNGIAGHLHSTLTGEALQSWWVLGWRTARAVIIVPVVEELFWRGWLMRWLIDTRFERISLGQYTRVSFWITAALFSSEHGPYWDVGLVTGITYNLWMIRSKSLADCVLMHAVTNGLLSAYVIAEGQWQYWQ